jgi:hypothetical protein
MLPHPFCSELFRSYYFVVRHSRGYPLAQLVRFQKPALRRNLKPHMGLCVVLPNTLAVRVHHTDVRARHRVARSGGSPVPLEGVLIIPLNALAICVCSRYVKLCQDKTLIGG